MDTFVRLARSRITTGVIWLVIGLAIPFVVETDAFRIGQFNYIVSIVMVSIGLNLLSVIARSRAVRASEYFPMRLSIAPR